MGAQSVNLTQTSNDNRQINNWSHLYTHEHLMNKTPQLLLTECLLTKDQRDKLMLPYNLCEILEHPTQGQQ